MAHYKYPFSKQALNKFSEYHIGRIRKPRVRISRKGTLSNNRSMTDFYLLAILISVILSGITASIMIIRYDKRIVFATWFFICIALLIALPFLGPTFPQIESNESMGQVITHFYALFAKVGISIFCALLIIAGILEANLKRKRKK